jgi:hypothetical protein
VTDAVVAALLLLQLLLLVLLRRLPLVLADIAGTYVP